MLIVFGPCFGGFIHHSPFGTCFGQTAAIVDDIVYDFSLLLVGHSIAVVQEGFGSGVNLLVDVVDGYYVPLVIHALGDAFVFNFFKLGVEANYVFNELTHQ